MAPKKTRLQREEELRSLIATPEGRASLEALACRYEAASGRVRPAYTSVISYIIVHERVRGIIDA